MIVLDASATVEWLLQTQAGIHAAQRLSGEILNAPQLLDIEVAQVVRRQVLQGSISASRALQAIQDLSDSRIRRYAHKPLLTRIWSLRSNLSAYDAAYVALAEVLEAPLLTRDARIARAAGHNAIVEVL